MINTFGGFTGNNQLGFLRGFPASGNQQAQPFFFNQGGLNGGFGNLQGLNQGFNGFQGQPGFGGFGFQGNLQGFNGFQGQSGLFGGFGNQMMMPPFGGFGQQGGPQGPFGGFGQQGGPQGLFGGTPPTPEELFTKLDTDGNGSLTQAELENGRPPGMPEPTDAMKAEHLARLDANSDGTVSKEEFIQAESQRPPRGFGFPGMFGGNLGEMQRVSPEQRFATLDTDNSGTLTQAEWESGRPANAPPLSDTEKAQRWARMDANSDGTVSKEEFVQAHPQRSPRNFGFGTMQGFNGFVGPQAFFGGNFFNNGLSSIQATSADQNLSTLDSNNDGSISKTEFESSQLSGLSALSSEVKAQLWARLDANNDGQISQDELSKTCPQESVA